MSDDEGNEAPEPLLDHALRTLPLRRAPPTLESRVLREIERRAALAWWRRSFAQWPLPARAAFLVTCAFLIRAAFLGGAAVMATVRSSGWAREVGTLMSSSANLAELLARSAPTWLYAGLAVCAVLYVVLFGLGAALYRTLYLQPAAGELRQ
ncbi:MAG: hypothetical protein NVS1B6_11400 [Steroidobacteraceae bacterium]